VQVNHPARVGPYLVYQSSWQEREQGVVSVLLAVKDPSSPLAFVSIAFMVMGLGMTYVPKLRSLLEAS
jgi:cytochrome c biogenesis protein